MLFCTASKTLLHNVNVMHFQLCWCVVIRISGWTPGRSKLFGDHVLRLTPDVATRCMLCSHRTTPSLLVVWSLIIRRVTGRESQLHIVAGLLFRVTPFKGLIPTKGTTTRIHVLVSVSDNPLSHKHSRRHNYFRDLLFFKLVRMSRFIQKHCPKTKRDPEDSFPYM